MFKDKYIKENENIVPDESVKRYIKSKLKEGSKKADSRPRLNALIAMALTLFLALGVVWIADATRRSPIIEGGISTAQTTYDDVYSVVNKYIKANRENFFDILYDFSYAKGSSDAAMPESSVLTGGVDDGDRGTASAWGDPTEDSSTTNNQVVGVDEADIVKNDGKYIYRIKNGHLYIFETNGGELKLISNKAVAGYNEHAVEMFLGKNRVTVLIRCYEQQNAVTKIKYLDITDKADPSVINTVKQSGHYTQARMVNNTVYVLSEYWLNTNAVHKNKPESYVPCISDEAIAPEDISIIEDTSSVKYLVVTASDIVKGEITANEAVLGHSENVYADTDNIYYTFTNYNNTKNETKFTDTTTIVKLDITPNKITTVATGVVDGRPLNQFSMDEYKGNLRIVTTVTKNEKSQFDAQNGESVTGNTKDTASSYIAWSTVTHNSLYVLDKELKVIGKIEDLAKNERVYSVRFDGKIGYFVTFRQTDPLFTVDLSDASNPKILSELKIPGFSEYLHPFGKDLLFGFGKSATDEGAVTGLKLSMFEVADPSNVTEKSVLPIDADYSEASYDHKAIMVDTNKNIIAFIGSKYSGVERNTMYIYGYDNDKGFVLRKELPLKNSNAVNSRFVWIGNIFYLVTETDLTAFDMYDFKELSRLEY